MNGLHSLLTVAVLHDRGVSGCAAFRRAFFIWPCPKGKMVRVLFECIKSDQCSV